MSRSGRTAATSAGHLLQMFRTGAVSTRRELQEATGLARSTLTQRLDQLLRAGYLVEGPTDRPTGGRRATRLVFDDETPTVVTADLGATHGRLAVCTAAGDVLVERVIETEIGRGPREVLTFVCDLLDELVAESGRDPATIAGCGMGVPGPVSQGLGAVVRAPIMPGWNEFPIVAFLRSRFSASAVVDNDANLMALGEQQVVHPNTPSLLFVKVGTGIGAALILDGTVFRGADGAEGDIGHAKIEGLDRICACGARGCLAAAASGGAMARELRSSGFDTTISRDVVDLVRRGEPQAVKAVAQSGRLLGEVLATAISMVNPERLVIGGDVAHVSEYLLPPLRATLAERTQPLASANLIITASRLGDRAGTAGAAAMVREAVFRADAVDAALARQEGQR